MNIGIIGAMEEEISTIKANMEDVKVIVKAGMSFAKGKIYGKEVVVVRSGIGKVNAAVCAQILIDLFGVDTVINTGIAGGLHKNIEIGDIVISTDAVQYDMDARAFGYERGQVPRLDTFEFKTDKELGELAYELCKEVNPEINVFKGRVVSGDIFVSDVDFKRELVEEFDAYCTEMEGAAIAQVAYLNNIKCLIIRAISDNADDDAGIDFEEFEKVAIKHCSGLSLELIKNL